MTTPQPAVSLSMPASEVASAEMPRERDGTEADAAQLNQLDTQLRALEAKALELMTAAAALYAELGPAACDEVEHAQREAGIMRSTIDTARAEINSAPTDARTGKKKVTAASVIKLTDTIGHLILGAETEKKLLIEAATEKSPEVKSVVKKVTSGAAVIVKSTFSKICHVGAGPATASAASHSSGGIAGAIAHAQERLSAATQSIGASIDHGLTSASGFMKETWASVTSSPAVQSAKATAIKAWDATVDVVTHPVASITSAASYVKQGAVSAYETVAGAAHEYVGKPVASAYQSAKSAVKEYVVAPVASAYESTKSAASSARDWVVGLFSGKDAVKPPVAVAAAKVAPPKPANDNKPDQSMLHALRQAAASVSLAVVAGGHSVTEIVGSNVPNLTSTGHSLSHFWQ